MIAEIQLREGHFSEALDYARRALDFNRINVPALSVMAVTQRRLDRRADASNTQNQILEIDPLNHLAAAEAWLMTASEQNRNHLTSMIRSELPHESYLELAIYYADLGMAQEAIRILRLSPSHPIIDYWLAYLTKDDAPAESKRLLESAAQASPRLVFPFRNETLPVLQWALSQRRDWKTLYYAGLLNWSQGHNAEAATLLSECRMLPDYGPFYLTRAELAKKSGQEARIEDLEKARQLAPDEWRSWLALARQFSGSPSPAEALKALEMAKSGFEKFPGNFVLGMEYAKTLINLGRYQDALDVLARLTVLPYENASEGRVLYEKAHLLLAGECIRNRKYEEALAHIAKSREWPEHLGVGKPYDPDERLQAFMESYCSKKLGKDATSMDNSAIEKLRSDLKRTSPWKSELLTALSR
jgi:tetratricopeptide (TPR) repeat protein